MSALDVDLLDKLKEDHDIIVTLEDGIVDGGFGQKIASYDKFRELPRYAEPKLDPVTAFMTVVT